MNINNSHLSRQDEQRVRNAYVICVVFALAFASVTAMYIYLLVQNPAPQLYILMGLTSVVTIASAVGMWFVRNNRVDLGVGLAILSAILVLPITSLLTRGLGIYLGIAQLAGVSLAITSVLSQRTWAVVGIFNFVSAIATAFLDITGKSERLALPMLQTIVPVVVAIGLFIFFIILVREFRNFGLRAKVTLGILFTGGVALGTVAFFAIDRTTGIIDTLSTALEGNVNQLAKEQLLNTVAREANRTDVEFNLAIAQMRGLVGQLERLHEQRDSLGRGIYWNATERMFQTPDGHYFNDSYSPRSVFIPSFVTMNDELVTDLNASAYLDFSAPFILQNSQQVTALYYTTSDGVITYYPNIRLGLTLPHDYDGRTQPAYRVATPLFDPNRVVRWSFPRQDPAGSGLITSVSMPVYFSDEFKGVMTADFRLYKIAFNVNSIKVGKTGYAFLIDKDGHIIAMPPAGYDFFGLKQESLGTNEQPKLTIFDGKNIFEVQQILNRMAVGGTGVISTNVDGNNVFMAYAPVGGNDFSLGVIVPVAELTQPVTSTRIEIAIQTQLAVRNAILILLSLLLGSILVSLWLGQLIASPVNRLTQTANQILEGDITAQAIVTSKDETGTLARAFNAMTSRLRGTLEGLEKTVDERTADLVTANERIEHRARQFQSIAEVARTISSTLDLDNLLTQITTVISREFGFYHVGVFLLDTAREYAVLSAANSEGGQKMLARGHRLKVGEKGLVGFVAGTNRPRVALDTGADAVFFNNPDLPTTRSEVALPLHAGDQVIGVLDVQSNEPNAFTQEDVAVLSTLADQVSIAIQNARQNEATRKALTESEALSRQFVRSGWLAYTKRQKLEGVRHTGAKATLLYEKTGKGRDERDGYTRQLKARGRGAVMSLPIKLRGQVIGSVEVRAPDNRKWDQDEMDIVAAIIERAAIAMENARLLAESQKRAAKEQTIGEITKKISSQSEVDELIKVAAKELSRTLPGMEIAIQINKENAE